MVMGVISWIMLGLIVGYIASTLATRRREGLAFDLFLGVSGALIGGWIFNVAGAADMADFKPWSPVIAGVGAVFALTVWHALRRSVSHA